MTIKELAAELKAARAETAKLQATVQYERASSVERRAKSQERMVKMEAENMRLRGLSIANDMQVERQQRTISNLLGLANKYSFQGGEVPYH